MSRIITALVSAIALVQLPAAAEDQCGLEAPNVRVAVLDGVCKVLNAVNSGNSAALQTLLAEDFSLTSITGRYYEASKREMIRRWTEPTLPETSSGSKLTKVFRVYQTKKFGFVSGEIEDNEGKGLACTTHTFTDVWEHRGSRWVWVHSHESGLRKTTCES